MLRPLSSFGWLSFGLLLATALQGQNKETSLGQQTFATCAGCHGLDGAGGEHAPNIATDSRIQQLPDSALLKIIRDGVPGGGMPAFGKVLKDPQIQAVLAYLRVLQGSNHPSAKTIGNPEKGNTLYFGRAGCAACHSVNGRGGFLAADLSGYGRSHSATDIRESIISPNKAFDSRRGTVTVATSSGETYRGIIRNEDNFSLQIQLLDGQFHFFNKKELIRLEHEPGSLMPADYATKLTPGEIDDIIGFLSQGAGAEKKQGDDDDE